MTKKTEGKILQGPIHVLQHIMETRGVSERTTKQHAPDGLLPPELFLTKNPSSICSRPFFFLELN